MSTDDALFTISGGAAGPGPTLTAMNEQIPLWEQAGLAVSVIERRMLRDQADAIDTARRLDRPTAVTGGLLGLLELLKGFGLAADSPPGGDSLDALVAQLAGND